MDSLTDKEDKPIVLPSIDEDKGTTLKCRKKSFNLVEFIDQIHEETKGLQCNVKVKERSYKRYLKIFLICSINLLICYNFSEAGETFCCRSS